MQVKTWCPSLGDHNIANPPAGVVVEARAIESEEMSYKILQHGATADDRTHWNTKVIMKQDVLIAM